VPDLPSTMSYCGMPSKSRAHRHRGHRSLHPLHDLPSRSSQPTSACRNRSRRSCDPVPGSQGVDAARWARRMAWFAFGRPGRPPAVQLGRRVIPDPLSIPSSPSSRPQVVAPLAPKGRTAESGGAGTGANETARPPDQRPIHQLQQHSSSSLDGRPWPELGSGSRACARWTPNLSSRAAEVSQNSMTFRQSPA